MNCRITLGEVRCYYKPAETKTVLGEELTGHFLQGNIHEAPVLKERIKDADYTVQIPYIDSAVSETVDRIDAAAGITGGNLGFNIDPCRISRVEIF